MPRHCGYGIMTLSLRNRGKLPHAGGRDAYLITAHPSPTSEDNQLSYRAIRGERTNIMATLPFAAHGDTLPLVKVSPKYAGSGDTRHIEGTVVHVLLLFDNCAQIPITIPGLDAAKLPAPEVVTERNMKLDFIKARFTDLVISFSGGDYGAIRYRGTASGIEILNPGK